MRILIHRLGSMGDTVVTLPCFYIIRQVYPDAHITVLTNPPVSEKAAPLEAIVGNMGLFDDALYYPMASRDYAKLIKLHGDIRRRRFDLYISLTHGRNFPSSVRDFIFFKTCGIGRVIGLPWSWRHWDGPPVGDGTYTESEAVRLLRRTRAIAPTIVDGVDPNEPRWSDLKLTPAEKAEGRGLLDEGGITGPYLVASVGTKWRQNEWGVDNWRELISRLGELYPQLALVFLGSSDETERCNQLLNLWTGPGTNLCGKCSPRISSAVMSCGPGRLFIGHDSGPMHLAAASGLRCIAIFSALNPPGRWFPLRQGHTLLYPHGRYRRERWTDIPYQQQAIRSFTVDTVLQAIRGILDEPKP